MKNLQKWCRIRKKNYTVGINMAENIAQDIYGPLA